MLAATPAVLLAPQPIADCMRSLASFSKAAAAAAAQQQSVVRQGCAPGHPVRPLGKDGCARQETEEHEGLTTISIVGDDDAIRQAR